MSSLSIGKNSDDEEVGSRSSASDEENKAQSRFSGRLYVMEELEQVLPIRRGISKFYYSKSKSFTSLADAYVSSSIQEIIKPENMYARRRRNLLAFNRVWDNVRSSPRKGNATGGISKRPLGSSKSMLALAVAMTHSDSYSYSFWSSSPCKGNATGGIPKRPLGSSKSTLALAVALTHSESYSYSSASDDSSSSNFSKIPVLATSPIRPLPPLHPRCQGSLDHHGSPRQKNTPSWMLTITVPLQCQPA